TQVCPSECRKDPAQLRGIKMQVFGQNRPRRVYVDAIDVGEPVHQAHQKQNCIGGRECSLEDPRSRRAHTWDRMTNVSSGHRLIVACITPATLLSCRLRKTAVITRTTFQLFPALVPRSIGGLPPGFASPLPLRPCDAEHRPTPAPSLRRPGCPSE